MSLDWIWLDDEGLKKVVFLLSIDLDKMQWKKCTFPADEIGDKMSGGRELDRAKEKCFSSKRRWQRLSTLSSVKRNDRTTAVASATGILHTLKWLTTTFRRKKGRKAGSKNGQGQNWLNKIFRCLFHYSVCETCHIYFSWGSSAKKCAKKCIYTICKVLNGHAKLSIA